MSLATRCTACGTVFRVVQDQLKVSEGWVRCGRCDEVFNALEGLFDLERDTPPEWVPGHALQSPPAVAADPSLDPDRFDIDAGEVTADDPSLVDKIDAQLVGTRHGEASSTPATRIDERDRLEFPDARFDPELMSGEDLDTSDPLPFSQPSALLEPAPASAEAPTPEFLQQAHRQAQWQRPARRGALAAAAVVLAALLALQWGHQFRDMVAARWPAARPVVLAWCGAMACSVEAPRRIDDVAVESTALTRAAADAFRLSVTLRNHGGMTVALPSVDLSLTDANGQLIARKVLSAADFKAPSTLMPSGTESALQALLSAGTARVAGYTVEIFYP